MDRTISTYEFVIDRALVNRYFGSKEQLFTEVAAEAFQATDLLEGDPKGLGLRLARHLMGPIEGSSWAEGFDPFQLLLRSAVSPVASSIVASQLTTRFVQPITALLGGKNAELRAELITSSIVGFALMRVALQSPAIHSANKRTITELLAASIQQIVECGSR